MQLYIDNAGIRRSLASGRINIDVATGEPVHAIIWDTDVNGPIPAGIDLETQLGGLTVVNGRLVFDQATKDADDAAKATLASDELAAKKLAYRAEAIAELGRITRNGMVQRAFAIALLTKVNACVVALGGEATTPAQLIAEITTLINSGNVDGANE